jgi:predicted dehydrogenase
MTERVRFGVLGCADIALNSVIPGIQVSEASEVVAIASRSAAKSADAAAELGIPRSHGSYEALLSDPEVEAVYIPLPNHLHEEWTVAAAAAGKHVLCEKPLAMTSEQARHMVEVCAAARVKLMEAFMYRLHPMWHMVRRMVDEGRIGELVAIQSFFSYRNLDPGNIRNIAEFGGGALFDVGCYPVNMARMMFGAEPTAVKASIRRDENFGTDVVTSAVLDFGGRHATFTVSTQAEDSQHVQLVGTQGRLLIEIPYNIPPDRPTTVLLFSGGDPPVAPHVERFQAEPANQYGLQADAFARSIREDTGVPTPPEDAVANLEVIERIFADAGS